MAKHIPFKINMEHPETVDACIVWCFDPRMHGAFRHFIDEMGYEHFDPIMLAGGAKDLSDSASAEHRNALFGQIKKSVGLHNPGTIVLMVHSDCGAFGYLKAFDNDLAKERMEMEGTLHGAKDFLEKNLESSPSIILVFVDEKGLHIL